MKKMVRLLSLLLVALMLCTALVACGPAKDPADAKDALSEAGYAAVKGPGIFGGCTDVVSGTNLKTGDHISIYYFESATKAKEAFEDVEEMFDDKKDDDSEWVIKRSGKMIYFGTKEAVKAAG